MRRTASHRRALLGRRRVGLRIDVLARLPAAIGELPDDKAALDLAGLDDGLEGRDGVPRLRREAACDRETKSVSLRRSLRAAVCVRTDRARVDDDILLGLELGAVDGHVAEDDDANGALTPLLVELEVLGRRLAALVVVLVVVGAELKSDGEATECQRQRPGRRSDGGRNSFGRTRSVTADEGRRSGERQPICRREGYEPASAH
jgi:hypothetical protein